MGGASARQLCPRARRRASSTRAAALATSACSARFRESSLRASAIPFTRCHAKSRQPAGSTTNPSNRPNTEDAASPRENTLTSSTTASAPKPRLTAPTASTQQNRPNQFLGIFGNQPHHPLVAACLVGSCHGSRASHRLGRAVDRPLRGRSPPCSLAGTGYPSTSGATRAAICSCNSSTGLVASSTRKRSGSTEASFRYSARTRR